MTIKSTIFIYKEYVYKEPYSPYYEEYKNHKFVIDHFMENDELQEHVWLSCVDDINLKLKGYVHYSDLQEINEKNLNN